ncbi:MAG: hypothetical protein ACRDTB_19285 [Actinophytocola sp.]
MLRKVVRFYELLGVREEGNGASTVPVSSDFWQLMAEHVKSLSAAGRQARIRGRLTHGESRTGKQPALPYFYIAGVRERSEWPDSLSNRTGVVGDLEPTDQDAVLIEPTYVVPFGASNQVAVVTMSIGAPRVTTLESWFSHMLPPGAPLHSYTLLPVINSRVAERLAEARGAAILRVKMTSDVDVPEVGGGEIGDAARAAKRVSQETDIELGWTLDRRSGHDDTKAVLLQGAQWVRSDFVTSARVSLELPDGDDGFHRKQYDLIKQQFTSTQKFDIKRDEQPSELSVLTGINEAIEAFRKEFS